MMQRGLLDAVMGCISQNDAAGLTGLLAPLHAADIADLLEQMSAGQRRALLGLWSGEVDGDILSEISDAIREEVIAALPRSVVSEAMRELDTDDVIDIVEDLEPPPQAAAPTSAKPSVCTAAPRWPPMSTASTAG